MSGNDADDVPPCVRLIVLGNPDVGDDGAALAAAAELELSWLARHGCEFMPVGRIGTDLLELLEPEVPVVLADVVVSGAPAGTVHELDLQDATLRPAGNVSTHGFGPTEVLELARALGRALPEGRLVGIEGQCFEVGSPPSNDVRAALPRMRQALMRAVTTLAERADA